MTGSSDQSLPVRGRAGSGAESDQPGDEHRKIELARDRFDGRDLTREKAHWYIAISQGGYRGQADIQHLDALGICRWERPRAGELLTWDKDCTGSKSFDGVK